MNKLLIKLSVIFIGTLILSSCAYVKSNERGTYENPSERGEAYERGSRGATSSLSPDEVMKRDRERYSDYLSETNGDDSGVVTDTNNNITIAGYSIQAGAFGDITNAANFVKNLEGRKLEPYYFKDESGFYKVRFGDFKTEELAKRKASELASAGVITEYFIVPPSPYITRQIVNSSKSGKSTGIASGGRARNDIVKSAYSYVGVPYRWGGDSVAGIDCSGLTQAVYNLNGLNLPRNSREQFRKGRHVPKDKLEQGDLVFFATNGSKVINHVGVYVGSNKFIHAPSSGKSVTTAELNSDYFKRAYVGARTYIY